MSDYVRAEAAPVTAPDSFDNDAAVHRVLAHITGERLTAGLLQLATIGGTELPPTRLHPQHIATNRLALSPADTEAQETFVRPRMEAAGMEVASRPLALIGRYAGQNPEAAPVVIMSHTDTVPNGDVYDGTLGVLGGIEVVRALQAENIRLPRDILVVSLTGEESAGFGCAMFGSRALFQGLTDKELQSAKPNSRTIREALGEAAAEAARQPVFGPNGRELPTPHAVIELHVEQHTSLAEDQVDMGIVSAIAAPERYKAVVGDSPLLPDTRRYTHAEYLQLEVRGIANHSGATPMGEETRLDGLLETARLLQGLLDDPAVAPHLTIGDIAVDGGAINKIPGVTRTSLRLTGETAAQVQQVREALETAAMERVGMKAGEPVYLETAALWDEDFIDVSSIAKDQAGRFFAGEEMVARHRSAFHLIEAVNEAALAHSADGVVGTVGTYTVSDDGRITLEVDIRGIQHESRAAAINRAKRTAFTAASASVDFGKPLPGSGEPVVLSQDLVAKAAETIDSLEIGSTRVMVSAAGHDTQNAARAGIPSVMLFSQSGNGGLAHHPDAYTVPENLQKAVRALAAVVIRLAGESEEASPQASLVPQNVG